MLETIREFGRETLTTRGEDVRHIHVAGGVDGEALGRIQLGCGGWAVVAREALRAGACEGRKRAVGGEPAHRMTGAFCEEKVSLGVICKRRWKLKRD